LQRGLESFEDVPVISFGWVAFFILIYILIVGPLDYLFLKKVFKRLELTWATLPLVVLIVSVAVYITAYRLKGSHLRINKIDVVDINLREGQVHGTTWFSLFSPRVQRYVIGIEPTPDWSGGAEVDQDRRFRTVVTTMNAPDSSVGGVDRPGSQPLFRRPFQYARDASGLRGVPVPVWASRSFTASWGAPIGFKLTNTARTFLREEGMPKAVLTKLKLLKDPSVEEQFLSDLRRLLDSDELQRWQDRILNHARLSQLIEVSKDFGLSKDGVRLGGRIDNHLPVELSEVSLFYAGRWYPLANLPARASYRLEGIPVGDQSNIPDWLREPFRHIESPRARESHGKPTEVEEARTPVKIQQQYPESLMKALLFHGHRDNPMAGSGNIGLRFLDQGWRLRPLKEMDKQPYLDEVIVIGRAVQPSAAAEEVNQDGVSPTRLWLGRLPEEGERESLKGFLGQETFVRIYIPIRK
jgi:hypothetical protein